jgi:predicted dehydrogenase
MNCDAVIITAATTSNDPINLAARLCRDRGRVVVVGDVNIDVPRALYYERELELRLSRSYGPGRYDREYEERGLDYPIGYVRWTEQRNMASFVELLAKAKLDVDGLILERVPVERAPEAYESLVSSAGSPLGIVLQYEPAAPAEPRVTPTQTVTEAPPAWSVANVIGTGSFAQRILIPGLKTAGFKLRSAASARGLSAKAAVDRFGFIGSVTPEDAVRDSDAGLIAIATRHSSHAALAKAALRAGKAVFVEKPPALTDEELSGLRDARASSGRPLFVGFNRRFAPLAQLLRDHVRAPSAPIELLFRVNAGSLPRDHWLSDPEEGGGRLLGEGCHFIDFACWVVGFPVSRVQCLMCRAPEATLASSQGFSATLEFSDGSLATILYAAQGADALPKEYVEAHAAGRTALLDDFRSLKLMHGHRTHRKGGRSQDKGHLSQFIHLYNVLNAGTALNDPDPLDSMATTLTLLTAAQTGETISELMSESEIRLPTPVSY